MKHLENIIETFLAGKTDEELKSVLNDLDSAMVQAVKEDQERCNKFYNLAKDDSEFIEYSSKELTKD